MYVGRGVRTVQRYEVQLGFPVRRPAGILRGSVMAFSDEIDAWLNRAPTYWQQIVNKANDSTSIIKVLFEGHQTGEEGGVCPLCLGSGKIRHSNAQSVTKDDQVASVGQLRTSQSNAA